MGNFQFESRFETSSYCVIFVCFEEMTCNVAVSYVRKQKEVESALLNKLNVRACLRDIGH